MHIQLSLLEEVEDGVGAVWSTLDDAQRAAIITTLARMIAKLAVADHTPPAPENDHE